eukprot:746069-Hanusia_phi.AAC.1
MKRSRPTVALLCLVQVFLLSQQRVSALGSPDPACTFVEPQTHQRAFSNVRSMFLRLSGSITHKLAAISAFQLAPDQFRFVHLNHLDEARSQINSRIRHVHWQLKSFVETFPDTLQTAHSQGILGLVREKLKKSSHLPCLDVNICDSLIPLTLNSLPLRLPAADLTIFQASKPTGAFALARLLSRWTRSKILKAFSISGWVQVTKKDGIEVWKRDASDIETGSFPQGHDVSTLLLILMASMTRCGAEEVGKRQVPVCASPRDY